MRLAFLTCFHDRARLSELFIRHTSIYGAIYGAVTENDTYNKRFCEQHGVQYVMMPNEPLGAKWNAAQALAMTGEWDALLILGSDDFIDPVYLEAVKHELSRGFDYLFPATCGMYDVATRRAVILSQQRANGALSYGAGRVLSRRLVEAVGPMWTPERMKGLDTDAGARVMAHGFKGQVIGIGPDVPCVTDVKSGVNLWRFDTWAGRGRACSRERALGMVSVEIAEAIDNLLT